MAEEGVIVIGGCGFVGLYVVKALLEKKNMALRTCHES